MKHCSVVAAPSWAMAATAKAALALGVCRQRPSTRFFFSSSSPFALRTATSLSSTSTFPYAKHHHNNTWAVMEADHHSSQSFELGNEAEDMQGLQSVPSSSGKARDPVSYFPKRGQELELVCESLAFKGKGVCKVKSTGFVVLCDRALPGETLVGRIVKKKGSYAEACKLKTISPHDNAIIPPCLYAGDCGGCKMQNLAYEAQIVAKQQQVYDLILRVGNFKLTYVGGSSETHFRPIVPCASQYHYRNKMEFSFGVQRWKLSNEHSRMKEPPKEVAAHSVQDSLPDCEDFALGLHAPGRFDKILHIEKCLLQHDVANQVLVTVHEFCQKHIRDVTAFNARTHCGFLRHLMIRSGRDCQNGELQLMVNVVTSDYEPDLLKPLVEHLVSKFPQVVSILNNVTASVGGSAVGEHEYLLHGVRTITECLRGLSFEISANSFFQTNTAQAEVLYKLVEEACMLRGDCTEVVWDLFCGTGTIGLTLAKRIKHVYGYEIVPEAVADACRNAERNNIHNATFIQGDLNKLTAEFGRDLPSPDIVIIDPNRPGLHPKLTKFLTKLKAPRIVYVSCNPATCARDLDYLCHAEDGLATGSYRLVSVQPVDMFPHTPHIECVCALESLK
ncbi:hypothetical protein O6H91_23G050100 [Diphasiastrum complanatum]|uniref:Uncharacterized protein n=2 Tax=Diphasiastrum complanatum TaxID=34168 RepID=A0ACC2AAP4_DIPCM|nr:hypothetical protein O6H91_23G049800 [Diphasiastrum complanatum]KAJ7514568.1 hypothetical protein O6H91_23G050100 [Diphasiastrum complanatum]